MRYGSMRGTPLRLGVITIVAFILVAQAFPGNATEEEPRLWAILISGISGDPDLQKGFLEEIRTLHETLEGSYLVPRERIRTLFDDPAMSSGLAQLKSTRENLEKVCREVAAKARREDIVFVYLAGHGSQEGKTYKLNLVGPDPTGEELATMIYSIPAERFVVANTTTCSGGSIPALARKGKIVLTATKSGNEKNRTHMGRFFVESFKDLQADVDKNGRVSILEAFNYALKKTEEYYAKEGSLQTEHPVLDDNGDAQATDRPSPENGDGFLARTTFLDIAMPVSAAARLSPEEQDLVRTVRSLENQIEALKYAKVEMPEAEYEKKLEELLLKLAETNAKLRKK